jgi:soluble lytic murein transglycosylase-like protein
MTFKLMLAILSLLFPNLAFPASKAAARRAEAEYYVAAYAHHYQVPERLVRAIIERESTWRECAVSQKGAVGLMQLMPRTAERLQVRDRCDIEQNISGGVRYRAPYAYHCRFLRSESSARRC